MAHKGYLKLGSIKGGSKDPGHKGEMEIESFSWGFSGTGSPHGNRRDEQKPSDALISKFLDDASPRLYEAAKDGSHFPEAVVTLAPTDGKLPIVYVLSDAMIISIKHSAGRGPGPAGAPVESFHLAYKGVKTIYNRPDQSVP